MIMKKNDTVWIGLLLRRWEVDIERPSYTDVVVCEVFSNEPAAKKWRDKLLRRRNRECVCHNMDQYMYDDVRIKEVELLE